MRDVEPINDLYGNTLITLIRDMRLSAAHQKINKFSMTLLELGYSRQELVEGIKVFLEEEK
ncbi:hypothetical protein [Cellulosilyticum sp. I15G10I2]|uniref:hypothetical protein n=1 Tax=Cellulosilyticum sp. I15G10I2 TaxID=1892843 RepID=UPI00085C4FBE|nr:hypothetical protein [Cellulosilyticum sp. I15G10I2]